MESIKKMDDHENLGSKNYKCEPQESATQLDNNLREAFAMRPNIFKAAR